MQRIEKVRQNTSTCTKNIGWNKKPKLVEALVYYTKNPNLQGVPKKVYPFKLKLAITCCSNCVKTQGFLLI